MRTILHRLRRPDPLTGLGIVGALPYVQPEAPPGLGPGKVVVVEFWATWCPPCVESVPHLVELDERERERGLVVVGVHAPRGAGERERIESFLTTHGVQYAIALDRDGKASSAYAVSGIPKAFVYGRDGVLAWEGHPLEPAFEQAVERALGS